MSCTDTCYLIRIALLEYDDMHNHGLLLLSLPLNHLHPTTLWAFQARMIAPQASIIPGYDSLPARIIFVINADVAAEKRVYAEAHFRWSTNLCCC
jgi:hypothetical protein